MAALDNVKLGELVIAQRRNLPSFVMVEQVAMFARKIRVEYEDSGERKPCPLKWLDNFSMRNFTNATVFDDTLPVADGRMEIGTNVPIAELTAAMEDWFRRRSYLSADKTLEVTEILPEAISR